MKYTLSALIGKGPLLPAVAVRVIKHRALELAGVCVLALPALVLMAVLSYSPLDPSLNVATDAPAHNILGVGGAIVADILVQIIGIAFLLPVIIISAWGKRLLHKELVPHPLKRLVAVLVAVLFMAAALHTLPVTSVGVFHSGLGGWSGLWIGNYISALGNYVLPSSLPASLQGMGTFMAGMVAFSIGSALALYALGWSRAQWHQAALHTWQGVCAGCALMRAGLRAGRKLGRHTLLRRAFAARTSQRLHTLDDCQTAANKTMEEDAKEDTEHKVSFKITAPLKRVKKGRKERAEKEPSLPLAQEEQDSAFQYPPLYLLKEMPPTKNEGPNKASIDKNATYLGNVLADFGVRGDIVNACPGPVVTLYELEPAPGIKTSRVVGLADDIARSMSAVSVRIAVVPGRSVIGIELPNQTREMVYLHELLSSHAFEKADGNLRLILGKDIGGNPICANLAKMPHLLIAGTTGSGKSVGMNTMILSLLYRLTPEECKFIMIDPKMLELSVYDDIPHLLTPVVTDPSKAVVALKWAVREMEQRYASMAHVGVRSLAGFNARVNEANKKGEVLTRRVQTGFDHDGTPIYEEMPLADKPLPYIVVVVDEMADLMLVAGKDVEAAIQRLAQMARAAGIHLIMATQRPSVDVITGTIKANFPTRISFQVTSKIDSRTILGEQGAENLLGHGDMLYMAGGGRITRVHGPFVSDEEVEEIVTFLKQQGKPSYLEEITDTDAVSQLGSGSNDSSGTSPDDKLYDEAVAIVAREGKASTSFIQRHLQIGYNRAARIIERMESEGVVSTANRVGKREVLVGAHGH